MRTRPPGRAAVGAVVVDHSCGGLVTRQRIHAIDWETPENCDTWYARSRS